MVTPILKSDEVGTAVQTDQFSASDVKATLRLILESHPFRTSKQCQDLLRYVVAHSISGDDSALRERIIGAEVFGRKPGYDTNDDPVVRVRAADVRKRLAQYYQALEPGNSTLHIELHPGSYRAHFSPDRSINTGPVAAAVAPGAVEQRPTLGLPPAAGKSQWLFSWRGKVAVLALVALTIAGVYRWVQAPSATPQERFWAPLTTAKQPVLIYLGANVGYVFTSDFLAKYRATHNMPNTGPEFFVDLPSGSQVRFDDLLPVKDTFVTAADVAAIVEVTTQLRDWNKPFVLRAGRDLSIGDLRNQPSVMIGGFNNPWTIELTNDLPFSFRKGIQIENRDHPDRSWTVSTASSGILADDYALITRLQSSKTGGPLITAAGIGEYGTQAAAEFLTNPEKMRELLKTAPRGWENKNMEAVLHVKVEGYLPGAVEVVATSYW